MWRFVYAICMALMTPLKASKSANAGSNSEDILNSFEIKLKNLVLDSSLLTARERTHEEHGACNTFNNNNNSLPPECILSKILLLQSLNQEEPSSIFEVYKKICPIHASSATSTGLADSSTPCPSQACIATEVWYDEVKKISSVLTEEEQCRLQNFLLSATAKDCSLMVAISSNERNCHTTTQQEDSEDETLCLNDLFDQVSYKVKLRLADMDIKPITCIPKQCIRDCDMLKSFKELNN